MKIIHETRHGNWFISGGSKPDQIFVNFINAECTRMACYAIIDGEILEQVHHRIGARKTMPAIVFNKARKAVEG